ncbi:hypothetical protein [Ekhidna sp.]|uniref:hypothetical protein n=1 Tax=Ekhidna sp. TaxID=2608089 RepID=UPI003C7AF4C8
MKKILYLGNYLSIAFGLAMMIASMIAMILLSIEWINTGEFIWETYKTNLFLFAKPIFVFNLITLGGIKVLSIWSPYLRLRIIYELDKPIDHFIEKLKTQN